MGAGTSLARSDKTVYNADNTVAETIQNYKDGVYDPAHPDEDVATTYGYDDAGRQVWVRDALGRYDVTHYNAAGQVDWSARNLQPFQLDSQGQTVFQPYAATAPDANVATLYGYDGLGRTTLVTETGILTGTFNPTTLQFSDTTTRVTCTEYDALSRPVTVTLNYRPGVPASADTNIQTLTYYDGAGNLIWQRDAFGRWTKTEYDALNRPVKTIANYQDGDPLSGARDADLVSVTVYDQASRVEQQVENEVNGVFTATEPITDRVTLFAYDTLGRPTTTTTNYAPGASGTALNRTSTTTYDPATGRVRGQQDSLGRWVSQQYDVLGRVTTTILNCRDTTGAAVASGCAPFDPNVPDRNVPSLMRYDALGRAYETEDALEQVHHTAFDGLGRGTSVTQNYQSGVPADAETNVTSSMTYDALSRVTAATDPTNATTHYGYNGLGQTVIVTDTMNRVTEMGYDGTGTLRWTKRSDGQLTVYQLDGLGRVVTTVQNYQDGVVAGNEPVDQDLTMHTVYDAAGRQAETVDAAGRVTQFAYDNLDRLIGVTENVVIGTCANAPCNVTTQYQYDRAGNRTAIIDALGHVRRFTYDAANQPASATDALNQTTSWEYDAGGRVSLQDDPRGAANDLSYTYDELDRQTEVSATNLGTIGAAYDALGRRTQLTDATGTTSFDYDALGRMTELQAPHTGIVGYTYDASGRRTQLTYPDNTALSSTYWDDGQLHTVSQGTTTLASYTYDAAGRLDQVTRANGTTTSYDYDDADRLRDLRTTVGSVDVSRFEYSVDRLGLRISATETLSTTRVISYAYDGLLRLTEAVESPGASYAYAYDLAGNRTSVQVNGGTPTTYSYNDANQVTNSGYIYDAAGNLTSDGTTTYTYDALSRMSTRGTTTYSYNGDGALVFDGTTRYTQDLAAPLSQILQTTQGSATTNYVYGLDRLAGVVGSSEKWYGYDALGSVRQTLSAAGTPLGIVNYDPWGTPESGTVPTFGFTGELQDQATGLVNLRARWYSTNQGTFTAHRWRTDESRDTVPYSHHPYAYALSNPVLYTDPSGKCVFAVVDTLVCAGAAAIVIGIGSYIALDSANKAAQQCYRDDCLAGLRSSIDNAFSFKGNPDKYKPQSAPAPVAQPALAPAPAPKPQPPKPKLEVPGLPVVDYCPEPAPTPDLATVTPTPLGTPTPTPRPEMIWRAISLAPNRVGFNWSPTYADTDGLSGTRGGSSPYWTDPALWFEKSFGHPPDPTTDRIVATTEAALIAAGFSVENTPRLQDPQDPWHVSIGGKIPGIISDGKSLSWPGSRAERRRIRETLESLFTTQVWP